MKIISNRNLLYFIFIIILAQACIPSKQESPEMVLSPDRLVKKLESNRRKIKVFEGNGVIDVESPDLSASATFEVVIKKPDTVKISVYGPFGIDLAAARVTNNDFIFYDVLRNKVHRGKHDRSVLKNVFKVDLSFEDIMDAFAGAVNLTEKLRREPDKFEGNKENYFLTYTDIISGYNSLYTIDAGNLAITDYVIKDKSDKILFEGNYSRFKNYNDVPVPHNTRIFNESENQRLDIEYRHIKINRENVNVDIDIPSDAEVVEW